MDKSRASSLVVALIAGVLVVTVVVAQSSDNYDVEWSVIGSAGEQFVSGGSYQIGFTLAQDTPPLVSAGSSYQVLQGFWSSAGSLPTAVTLSSFWIEARDEALEVCWETVAEVDLLGFHVYRSDAGAPGPFVQINDELIPSQSTGSPLGGSYKWIDAGVDVGRTYFYLLEAVDAHGQPTRYGPVSATLQPMTLYRVYLPRVNR